MHRELAAEPKSTKLEYGTGAAEMRKTERQKWAVGRPGPNRPYLSQLSGWPLPHICFQTPVYSEQALPNSCSSCLYGMVKMAMKGDNCMNRVGSIIPDLSEKATQVIEKFSVGVDKGLKLTE